MREEEAKTKWCPMVRYHNNGEVGGVYCNKPESDSGSLDGSEYCIASDCMMWREHKNDYAEGFEGQSPEGGYCGLAK